jgi:hypothetical protein
MLEVMLVAARMALRARFLRSDAGAGAHNARKHAVLPDPCKKERPHGDLSQPPIFFFIAHLQPYFWLLLFYSFSTQILLLLAFLLLRLCFLLRVSLA